jgi:hypothetical protein
MMNRRNFLQGISLLSLGLAGLNSRDERTAAPEDFCLNLITDDSDRAIPMLEALLARALSAYKNLKFSEYKLAGEHIADLVLLKNRRLLDYKTSDDELARGMREIAQNLGLPRRVENPVLMKFYTEDRPRLATTLNLFGNNILLKQLSLTENQGVHQVESETGRVTLVIRNKSAKIIAATCRHKTCMNMGSINAAGQSLVCIPSRLRIAIEGQDESGLDGVTF